MKLFYAQLPEMPRGTRKTLNYQRPLNVGNIV